MLLHLLTANAENNRNNNSHTTTEIISPAPLKKKELLIRRHAKKDTKQQIVFLSFLLLLVVKLLLVLHSYSSSSFGEGSFSLWLLVRSQWLHRMPIIFAVSQADSRIIRSECTFIVLSIVFFGFGICIGFQMFFACLKLHSKKLYNFEIF